MAETNTAKERGYGWGASASTCRSLGRGRCEACQGDGVVKVEMHFLPDVYVPCDICHGQRYNRETLEVQWKGKNIAQILELTVEEAAAFFRTFQPSPQAADAAGRGPVVHPPGPGGHHALGRRGAAREAGGAVKRDTGRTLYILDRPTTGLHFADIDLLLRRCCTSCAMRATPSSSSSTTST